MRIRRIKLSPTWTLKLVKKSGSFELLITNTELSEDHSYFFTDYYLGENVSVSGKLDGSAEFISPCNYYDFEDHTSYAERYFKRVFQQKAEEESMSSRLRESLSHLQGTRMDSYSMARIREAAERTMMETAMRMGGEEVRNTNYFTRTPHYAVEITEDDVRRGELLIRSNGVFNYVQPEADHVPSN